MAIEPPLLSQCIALFPRLESITLHSQRHREGMNFSTVDQVLQEFEDQHGSRHPLKRISLKGVAPNALTPMLDLFKRGPIGLETLVMSMVEFDCRHGRPLQCELYLHPDLASASWNCVDSLMTLEMANVRFVDAPQTMAFFERLQEFARLSALRISRYHLLDLLAAKVKLRLNADQSLVVDEDENKEDEEDGWGRRTKRGLGLLFPAMRRMQVEPTHGYGAEEIQVYGAKLLIECCPAMKYFECCSRERRMGVNGSELRKAYPWIEIVDQEPKYAAF